jgi:hypothetical protein
MSLAVLFCLISPLAALNLQATPPKADKPKPLNALLKEKVERTYTSHSLMHSIAHNKKSAWIMFMGDSNMRHSYWWWVTNKLNTTDAKVKVIKSKQFSKGDEQKKKGAQWSDQEAIVEYPDGFQLRTSFRFLHGSKAEFDFKTKHWHSASKAKVTASDDAWLKETKLNEDEKKAANLIAKDDDTIHPSKYAKWAAKQQQFINFNREVPMLGEKLEKFKTASPDAVILTEGWEGIPGCGRFSEVLRMFQSNPDTKFVWSPIYVTNRSEKRHKCFAEKFATVEEKKGQNFKLLDMWDMASQLPYQDKTARNEEQTTHIVVGGPYMKTALHRFEDALNELTIQQI